MRHKLLRALVPVMLLCLNACNLAFNAGADVTATPPPAATPGEGQGIPVGTPITTSTCTVTTTAEANLSDVPGSWAQTLAVQGAGMTMPVVGISTNGWYQVPFGGDGGGNMMKLFVNPKLVTVNGDCSDVEQIQIHVPLTDCKVTNNTGSSQILHSDPELVDGNLTGRMEAGETLGVIKSQGGWFQVYSESVGNSAWAERRLVSTNDQCANI